MQVGLESPLPCNLTLLIHQKGTQDCFMDQLSGPIETKGAKCLLRVSVRVRLKT